MNNRGFVQYLVMIAVVLSVVFLSQQSFMRPYGIFAYSWSSEKIHNYWTKTSSWFKASVYPQVEKEAVEKGGALREEAIEQKDNIAQSAWKKIKNFFAEKFFSISGTKVE